MKRMPASARRYCPVMVQVHSRWMRLMLAHSVHEERALSPRDCAAPATPAVQRMKRQPSNEVTTMVSQAVMKV